MAVLIGQNGYTKCHTTALDSTRMNGEELERWRTEVGFFLSFFFLLFCGVEVGTLQAGE